MPLRNKQFTRLSTGALRANLPSQSLKTFTNLKTKCTKKAILIRERRLECPAMTVSLTQWMSGQFRAGTMKFMMTCQKSA
jgi:hypothetical protein